MSLDQFWSIEMLKIYSGVNLRRKGFIRLTPGCFNHTLDVAISDFKGHSHKRFQTKIVRSADVGEGTNGPMNDLVAGQDIITLYVTANSIRNCNLNE